MGTGKTKYKNCGNTTCPEIISGAIWPRLKTKEKT
jgi:hypothetical protein